MDKGIESILKGHRDAVTVKRIYGEPYEKNGVTIIPAARVMGGGGGGEGTSPDNGNEGSGSGFGLAGKPVGAYVIKDNEVTWIPAVDVNRIIFGALAFAAVALFVVRQRP